MDLLFWIVRVFTPPNDDGQHWATRSTWHGANNIDVAPKPLKATTAYREGVVVNHLIFISYRGINEFLLSFVRRVPHESRIVFHGIVCLCCTRVLQVAGEMLATIARPCTAVSKYVDCQHVRALSIVSQRIQRTSKPRLKRKRHDHWVVEPAPGCEVCCQGKLLGSTHLGVCVRTRKPKQRAAQMGSVVEHPPTEKQPCECKPTGTGYNEDSPQPSPLRHFTQRITHRSHRKPSFLWSCFHFELACQVKANVSSWVRALTVTAYNTVKLLSTYHCDNPTIENCICGFVNATCQKGQQLNWTRPRTYQQHPSQLSSTNPGRYEKYGAWGTQWWDSATENLACCEGGKARESSRGCIKC